MEIWSPKRCLMIFLFSTSCLHVGCGDAVEDTANEPNLVQFDTPQENDDESMEMGQGDAPLEPDTNSELSEPIPGEEEMVDIMDPDPVAGEEPTEMEMDTGGEQRAKVCEEPFDDGHLYSFSARSLTRGESVRMCEFTGQVILFVNTAANCGFTPQLTALEGLHRDYRDRPLTVLGFLTNDFAD